MIEVRVHSSMTDTVSSSVGPPAPRRASRGWRALVAGGALVLAWAPHATGQTAPPASTNPAQPAAGRVTLPTVIVTAQKEPADARTLPVSVTAVSADTIGRAGITTIGEAAILAPNTYFSELTARKISNPLFRGIGSSPANPGITSYYDGVPQLNTNSSSLDLMDVEQIELVRGPQSALFGRNSLGGLINIASARPSLSSWSGHLLVPFGSAGARDVRGAASGPLVAGRLGLGLALAYARRDGFTQNDLTGNDLDTREAFTGKGQLLWTPSSLWEARLIITGERARDGDYALTDLGALRENPFHTARDFEGHTDRDITATTILTRREGTRVSLSTTTGFVRWKTSDSTDLDYTPLPLVRRDNAERDFQFTQEVRAASAAGAPVVLGDAVSLKWQSGVFLFTQNYDQDAINHFSPFLLSPFIPVEVSQHSPRSSLDDWGVGLYGQATTTFSQRLDVSLGARLDREHKTAILDTFFSPPIAPDVRVEAERNFSNVSPQVSVTYRVQPERMVYASVGRGFKAGGFNPASPVGGEAYGEEQAWHVEAGLKTTWAQDRVSANVAIFSIDWNDLQLNLPNLSVPGQFYIANVGGARSTGAELEVTGRIDPGIGVFGAFGVTHARFDDGSASPGVDVSGNTLPNTPDYTAAIGAQWSRDLFPGASVYGRGDFAVYGAFQYNDANTAGQEAYSLANFRGGIRGRYVFGEVWVRNAFDTRYIPIAFAYGNFAPSGFVGEMGRPRTFGLSGGVTF
jgi:iron complex outermembrane receptor protein